MASKPETSFITGVHRHLPKGLHFEKMHNPYRGGTFDVWYSGPKDLWVEYKFIAVPKKPDTLIEPALSALQIQWGRERAAEGRNVAVIVGCKEGGVVFTNQDWLTPLPAKKFRELLMPRSEVAAWLVRQMEFIQ